MQANRSLPQTARNGQPTIEARAFCVAFIPAQSNISQAWSLKTSEAIGCLIDFRSAVHRWLASGQVDHAEFVKEVQRLEDAGLIAWVDELIATAMIEVTR